LRRLASLLLNDVNKSQLASNYIISDLLGLQKKDDNFIFPKEEQLKELIELISSNEISSRVAKDLLPEISSFKESVREIAEKRGLIQKNDKESMIVIGKLVIENNPNVVSDYKSGKDSVLMFLVGQFMKESRGSANPSLAKEVLEELMK
jgi:aspartyl-tRNA(Asn)/glutamyl-tRNA(Gln) amidotransferase subunit B